MAEKKTCSAVAGGGSVKAGDFNDVSECSDACKGTSTMFTFGRSDGRCFDNGKCRCYCQRSGSPDGTCVHADHAPYNLYRINTIGKSICHQVLLSAENGKCKMDCL